MSRTETQQYRFLRIGLGLAMTATFCFLFWLTARAWPIVQQAFWPTKLGCGCQVLAMAVPPVTLITAGLALIAAGLIFYRWLYFFIRQVGRSRRQIIDWTRPGQRTIYQHVIGQTIIILNHPGRQAMTMGLFKPRIYITADLLKSLAGSELNAVLRHEQAHRRRYDQLWSVLIDSFSAAWWRVSLFQSWVRASLTLRELSADATATVDYQQTNGLSGAIIKLTGINSAEGLIAFSPNQDRVQKLIDHSWRPKLSLWQWSYAWSLGIVALAIFVVVRLTPPAIAVIPPAVTLACQETRLLCHGQRQQITTLIFRCNAGSSELCLPRWSGPQSVYVFPRSTY